MGGLTLLQVRPAGKCAGKCFFICSSHPSQPYGTGVSFHYAILLRLDVSISRLWDEKVPDPVSRIGPIFLPSRTNMSVAFTIDGEEGSIQISVGRSDLHLLKDISLTLRELINDYDPHQRRPIQLSENKYEHVDIASIRYLLESIGFETARQRTKQPMTPEEEQKLKVRVANLSQLCNALHYFRCSPSPFLGLWDRQIQPWEVMPRPDGVWSWRIPRRNIRQKLQAWPNYPGHSANAAYVLQKDKEFSDALRFIVWDSVLDAVPTAVRGLKNTGGTPHPNNHCDM